MMSRAALIYAVRLLAAPKVIVEVELASLILYSCAVGSCELLSPVRSRSVNSFAVLGIVKADERLLVQDDPSVLLTTSKYTVSPLNFAGSNSIIPTLLSLGE